MDADYVFVDTGAFIALAASKDRYHEKAGGIYSDLLTRQANLLTTNYVVNETCNWLLYDNTLGHPAARTFGDMIRRVSLPFPLETTIKHRLPVSADLVLIYPSHDLEGIAWEIFCKYDTSGFSFTDCVSFAVMQHLGIRTVFAFDSHFDMLGFERL